MEGYKEGIFKISKDFERAKDLLVMAVERKEVIIKSIPKSVPYKLLEEYYEIAVQLITSIMYSEGYKTLGHIELIDFLRRFSELTEEDIRVLDNLRKFRHGTVYYGKKESGNYLINYEDKINAIINKLLKLAKERIK